MSKLYNLVVPCKSTIKEKNQEKYNSSKFFYFNKSCLVRLEPKGAVIIPPGMMKDFIYLDNSFKKIFQEGKFSLSGYSLEEVESLIENEIIIGDKEKKTRKPSFTSVSIDGLPVHALLDVTSACNCNCLSCYHRDDLDGFYPSLKDIKLRIDKLKELGILIIEVTGGEPLLRKDLPQILNYIKKKGLLYYIVSNGEYLADANQALIKALKAGKGLAISLDGYGRVHDRIRQRMGLFNKILKGLEFCLLNNIFVLLVSTLNAENINSVPKMLSLTKKYKCTLHLRPTIITGAALANDVQETYPVDQIRKYINHKYVRNGFLGEKRSFLTNCRYYGCGLRKRISVDVYGNIFPCVMDRSRSIGNILDFNAKTLFKKLVEESSYFLEKHKDCHQCSRYTESKKDPECSGFCRFSKSYKNNLLHEKNIALQHFSKVL